jgi:rare lipoprotein A
MYRMLTNTKARSHAIRATLTAAAAAVTLGWQTAPSEAREHHRHRHHHHHHQAARQQGAWQNAQASTGTTAFASTGRTFSGVASFYGNESGSRTASGQRMNPSAMTAAHRTLPFGTKVRVTHGDRSVVVTINDRGPFIRGRVLDLSTGAARAIGLPGVGRVTAEILS